jgi:hypothetical protein
MNDSGFWAPPPEPPAVHLVERPPQDHHARRFELQQSVRDQIELLHPALVRVRPFLEQVRDIDAPVAQTAALGIGRIVHVGHDAHQAALLPILDRRGIGDLGCDAPPSKVRIVGPQQCGPLARGLVNPFHDPEVRAVAKIRELPGNNPGIGLARERIEILQHRSDLWIRLPVGRLDRPRYGHARHRQDPTRHDSSHRVLLLRNMIAVPSPTRRGGRTAALRACGGQRDRQTDYPPAPARCPACWTLVKGLTKGSLLPPRRERDAAKTLCGARAPCSFITRRTEVGWSYDRPVTIGRS